MSRRAYRREAAKEGRRPPALRSRLPYAVAAQRSTFVVTAGYRGRVWPCTLPQLFGALGQDGLTSPVLAAHIPDRRSRRVREWFWPCEGLDDKQQALPGRRTYASVDRKAFAM